MTILTEIKIFAISLSNEFYFIFSQKGKSVKNPSNKK